MIATQISPSSPFLARAAWGPPNCSAASSLVRRIATGKKILLGDISEKNLERVANELRYSGYDVETTGVNALEKASVEAFAKKAPPPAPAPPKASTA